MNKLLVWILIILTLFDWLLSYIFFTTYGWQECEYQVVIRLMLYYLGLHCTFFIVLPAYFITLFWFLFWLTDKIRRIGQGKLEHYWKIILSGCCLIKLAVLFAWIIVYNWHPNSLLSL